MEDRIWDKLVEVGEDVATTKARVETLAEQNREQFTTLKYHGERIAVAEERYVHEPTCGNRQKELRERVEAVERVLGVPQGTTQLRWPSKGQWAAIGTALVGLISGIVAAIRHMGG